MAAGIDGRKKSQQARFCHGPDHADLQFSVVQPGAWGDHDASAVGGSVGECNHHGRPVVSSVESAG